DLKFNIFPCIADPALVHETERIKYENFFGKQQLEDACSDPVVVHFAGFKPWQDPSTIFADKWWELCRVTPFYEEILYKCILKNVIVTQRKRSKLNYCRCKALSKLTFGKKRAHYERKGAEIKKVLEIR
ncbi:MAG: hypothetical protein LBQ23_02955, partial [Puniceicoccales bacterium]|nr:hypothetical protein [Puniceicoccales bacterium]